MSQDKPDYGYCHDCHGYEALHWESNTPICNRCNSDNVVPKEEGTEANG